MSTHDLRKKLFYLGQKVNAAFDHPSEIGLRPKPEHFKAAAKTLGIKISEAQRAWHLYTWETP